MVATLLLVLALLVLPAPGRAYAEPAAPAPTASPAPDAAPNRPVMSSQAWIAAGLLIIGLAIYVNRRAGRNPPRS